MKRSRSCAPRFYAPLAGLLLALGLVCPALANNVLVSAYRYYAVPLSSPDDLAPLIETAARKKLVLLGESTHGTREYYLQRAEISRRLLAAEESFAFIAVEGDWVSLSRLNRYVKHLPGAPASARDALLSAVRWPQWLWSNEEFADFAEWLRAFNGKRPPDKRVGIYGLDVYAPWEAMDEVFAWYQARHPQKIKELQSLYSPFAAFRDNGPAYASSAARGAVTPGGAEAAFEMTRVLWEQEPLETRKDAFHAKQAARVVRGAEAHYRTTVVNDIWGWNERVLHMQATIDGLLRVYGALGRPSPASPRGIIWAHNTHIGDASATAMARVGRQNIGQLLRQSHGENQVFLVGFSTWRGQTLAARQWEGRREAMIIPEAMQGSLDATLKGMNIGDALLVFPPAVLPALVEPLGHRAIGVTYQPEKDGENYLTTIPAKRYDALIYIEETTPLRPLHIDRQSRLE